MNNLQLCISQQINTTPFAFKTTGVRVYTFEEVLYHVFHHWRDSADEFLSDGMIKWVGELGHSYLASKMKELKKKEPFTAKILDFLRLADYFAENELSGLKTELEKWEHRRDWEKLKERGDWYAQKSDPYKAISLYRRALQYEENAAILNNLGVQYLRLSGTQEALSCLTRALSLEPKNFDILLHYIEAAILNGSFDKAAKAIKKAYAQNPNCADIAFLLGLMSHEQKDFTTALAYYKKALEQDNLSPGDSVQHYIHKAVDVHLQMRSYEKALEALAKSPQKNAAHYAKEAEIHAAWGDISKAIKSMTTALKNETEAGAVFYAKLAAYHRLDYDTKNAEKAIKKAISLEPENNLVRLENARIKKGLGRTREYQKALADILKSFKETYRDSASAK
ncbi:MAG: tetratricopeptide repeat protein [Defluviitaleaceae bacterium]|nr:tetratricopeptide repeat protein [Defluviitaleaceae bacterium]